MNSKYIIAGLLFCTILHTSCEDPIEVDNGFETPQFVVDAWINNNIDETQIISLSLTQDYFDNRLPDAIADAEVNVSTSSAASYDFEHIGDGKYSWTPEAGSNIGEIGDTYIMTVNHNGEIYTSTTQLHPVPEIDSIRIYFEDEAFGADNGLYAEIYARDLPGKGNTYWVKSYRNDTLLNKPQELNLIYDATFDAGTDIDGTAFIRPLRFAVNALDEDGLPRDLDIGDKVGCEIHSISNEAFRFLQIAQEQTSNGDNGIFTIPVANSKGNVYDSNEERVLGVFNVAAISSLEKTVE